MYTLNNMKEKKKTWFYSENIVMLKTGSTKCMKKKKALCMQSGTNDF